MQMAGLFGISVEINIFNFKYSKYLNVKTFKNSYASDLLSTWEFLTLTGELPFYTLRYKLSYPACIPCASLTFVDSFRRGLLRLAD